MYKLHSNVLLFELCDADNRQIFLAVHDFLVKSKRLEKT